MLLPYRGKLLQPYADMEVEILAVIVTSVQHGLFLVINIDNDVFLDVVIMCLSQLVNCTCPFYYPPS